MTTREYITGFKKKHGRMPSQVELVKEHHLSPQMAIQALIAYSKEPIKEKQSKVLLNKKKDLTVKILKGFLILLSIMAFTLSVYFTGLWFSDKFHIFISGLISLSMVLFMVISPQVIRYVKNPFVKSVTVLSFLIALMFSMGSTVAGQFNAVTKRIENEPDKAYIFNQLTNSEEEVEKTIKEAQRDKSVHQSTIILLSETAEARKENWAYIETEREFITAFDERIDNLRLELKNVRDSQVSNGIIEEKRDFYLFISGLTGMEKSFTEFLISAMPAIFIDLIAALCLNLALFISPKEKKNE